MVTLMPTLSASGRKLKLASINAGKTRRAINKMAMPESIASFNSREGWTNEAVMLSYLHEVIIAHTKCAQRTTLHPRWKDESAERPMENRFLDP